MLNRMIDPAELIPPPDGSRPITDLMWIHLDALGIYIPFKERSRWRLAPAGATPAQAHRWARDNGYERIIELATGHTLARQPRPKQVDSPWPGLEV
jgi:hypothetical protein